MCADEKIARSLSSRLLFVLPRNEVLVIAQLRPGTRRRWRWCRFSLFSLSLYSSDLSAALLFYLLFSLSRCFFPFLDSPLPRASFCLISLPRGGIKYLRGKRIAPVYTLSLCGFSSATVIVRLVLCVI